jgi:periplasmic protein TonB
MTIVTLICSALAAQFTGVVFAQEAGDGNQVEPPANIEPIQTPPPPAPSQPRPSRAGSGPPQAAKSPTKLDQTRTAKMRGARGSIARILEIIPVAAKRDGLEGTVHLSVVVTPDGRSTDCVVTQSSGHPILDEAACLGMLRFSRFEPALNKDGKPVPGTFQTRISYFNQPD